MLNKTLRKMENLKAQLLNEFKKSLNADSKWFNEDMENFKSRLNGQSENELKRQLGNLVALNGGSAKFNKEVNDHLKELDKAGMFEMGNMSPLNALD